MNITFRQVDAFRLVVSMGSVTEAANVLGISQPAVSRLIAELETEVGFQLFRRSGRTLVPTDEARLLVTEVRQAVSGMEHIKDSAVAIARFGHARLKIVTTPSFSNKLLPDLLDLFCDDNLLNLRVLLPNAAHASKRLSLGLARRRHI